MALPALSKSTATRSPAMNSWLAWAMIEQFFGRALRGSRAKWLRCTTAGAASAADERRATAHACQLRRVSSLRCERVNAAAAVAPGQHEAAAIAELACRCCSVSAPAR